jgi:hypothetical protein
MKLTRRMKKQVSAAVRASGAATDKRVKRKEYAPTGSCMKKTVTYVWEPGSLVSILDTAASYKQQNTTGIVVGEYGAGYFEVLAMDGRILTIPGKRLRKAD